jgi:membrane-bound inhibitor of C-type lysozyme
MKMTLLLLLLLLSACASYTDPEAERLVYYKCERNQEIAVKHSEDYESIRIKVGTEQILLHYFVMDSGEGYRTEQYLWLVKGKEAKLINRKRDGTEEVLLGQCKAEKKVL